MTVKVAVVQKPPVLLDLAATMARALESMAEAAAAGSQLVIFPEAYLPGYPTWIWRLRPGGDMGSDGRHPCPAAQERRGHRCRRTDLLCEGARKHGLTVVCGMSEVDSGFSGSTLYNTVVTIGPDGTILNRHRKLMPTNPERMVWGPGDGTGLKVVDTPAGRIGTLICWESYMPLARYALYAQNIEIYVAPTWDLRRDLARHHAPHRQGGWLLGRSASPLPFRARTYPTRSRAAMRCSSPTIGCATAMPSSSSRRARFSRGPCTAKRAFSTATSIRPRHRGPAGRWTSPATTRAPTFSAWM